MNRFLKKFDEIKQAVSKKIAYKLFISFFLIGVVPLVVVNLYINSTYSKRLMDELDAQNTLVEKSIITELDDFFISLEQISIIFYQDNIKEILNEEENLLNYSYNSNVIEKAVRVNQDLYNTMDNFEQISFVKSGGLTYDILNSKRSIYDFTIKYDSNIEVNRYKNQKIVPVNMVENIRAPSEDFYVYVRKINDLDGEIGQLYIIFDKAVLDSIFCEVLEQSHDAILIISDNDVILYGDSINSGNDTVYEYEMNDFSIKVNFMRNQQKIVQSVTRLKRITFYILIASILLIVILSSGLSSYLVTPIVTLIGKLHSVKKGDYSKRIEINSKDELGELGEAFNEMNTEIDRLINQNYSIKLRENEATIAALQTQINPHFLYNTLEMIKNMSDIYGIEDVSKVILALSNTFRYATSTVSYIVSIEDELRNLENYITIVDTRYGGNISFEIDIDEEIKKEEIIKVCLQPIVENAISHGISQSGGKGTIKLIFEQSQENIIIRILDDGIGMQIDKLAEIQESLKVNNKDDFGTTQSVGLKNINERIRLHYGNEYGISINSALDIGTEVIVTYPKRLHEV